MTDIEKLLMFAISISGFFILLSIWRQIRDAYPPYWRRHQWQCRDTYPSITNEPVWKPWFAWRPVRTVSGHLIWLKRIYRTLGNDYVDHDDWSWYHYGTIFDVIGSKR